jgi:hypothetical protein
MSTFTVRTVGTVHDRPSCLVYVTLPDGTETRVRWQAANTGKGQGGYRCDEHGHLDYADRRPHAELADVVLAWQRQAGSGGHRATG